MMTRLALLATFLLASCGCPTLWLQVTKSDPSPWPLIPMPEIARRPIEIPAGAQNRFDVFEKGVRTVHQEMAAFTDRFDGRDDPVAARIQAMNAMRAIVKKYDPTAKPEDELTNCQKVDATLECLSPSVCRYLHIDKSPVEKPDAVFIERTGEMYPVEVAVKSDVKPSETIVKLSEHVAMTDNGSGLDVCLYEHDSLAKTLLSFVHLTDVQLRDPSVRLSDPELSRRLDWFQPLQSFEYDEDLAFYNHYVTEAVIATINEEYLRFARPSFKGDREDQPKFVIHTGDSIDSGTVGEARRFHAMIDRLKIPFYNLLGNHDVLVFGNLVPTPTRKTDKSCASVSSLLKNTEHWYVPNKLCVDELVRCPNCVGDEAALIAKPSAEASRQAFMKEMEHADTQMLAQARAPASTQPYCQTSPIVRSDGFTRAHGFDLGTADNKLTGKKLGYYAFVHKLAGKPERSAVMIALDTEELKDEQGGTAGRVGAAQLDWLKSVLECVKTNHPEDLVLVFAHQPLSIIQVEKENTSVAAVLEQYKDNVVGFFYGHDHEHAICGDRKRPGVCASFWEIETASIIEFPQEARMIRIKQISNRIGFLELTAFGEQLASQETELANAVRLGRRGAERDRCRIRPNQKCSDDLRVYRTDGRELHARLFFKLPQKPSP